MLEIEKLELKSENVIEDKINTLKQIFPEVFTGGNKIDFRKLELILGENIDLGKEKFGLSWAGKSDCFKIIQRSGIGTLVPSKEESINFEKTNNIFIEGDNLEVLKLLQKSYLGKIKMIYIDPPYNTGNDFIYPDNYTESLETYLKYSGQLDDEGRKYSTNAETDGRFHSKWLNMIYPRLFLARNLLKEEGVIFISIDDYEADNLKKVCNEIFGEENFIAQLIWKSRQNKDNRNTTGVSVDHEYVLCYGKKVRGDLRDVEQYSNPDNDPRGDWASGNMVGLLPEEQRPNCHYDLTNPDTGIVYPKPPMGWRYEKATMYKLIQEKRIIWPSEPNGRPRRKVFLNELSSEYTGYSSIIGLDIYTHHGTAEIQELFGLRLLEFPKPIGLLKELIEQGSVEEDDVILDFFAGSGSLAHALLDLQLSDKIKRKFICIQLPEPCDEKSEAYKAGFKTISAIAKERIKKAIKKVEEEYKQNNGKQLRLGEENRENSNIDLGVKIFRLQSSNFQLWDSSTKKDEGEIEKQLKLHEQSLSEQILEESILFEILLKSGFELSVNIKPLRIRDKQVYDIDNGSMLIYLGKEIDKDLIKEIANKNPVRFVCLDEAFKGDDQLKTNAVKIMESKGVEKFYTV